MKIKYFLTILLFETIKIQENISPFANYVSKHYFVLSSTLIKNVSGNKLKLHFIKEKNLVSTSYLFDPINLRPVQVKIQSQWDPFKDADHHPLNFKCPPLATPSHKISSSAPSILTHFLQPPFSFINKSFQIH